MSFYDTWPLKDAKPELLVFVEDVISSGLRSINRRFPAQAATETGSCTNPYEIGDPQGDEAVQSLYARHSEDELPYLTARASVFSSALCSFASGFRTYRKVVMWCTGELEAFKSYLFRLLPAAHQELQEVARALTAADDAKTTAQQEYNALRVEMQEKITLLQHEVAQRESERDDARKAQAETDDHAKSLEKLLNESDHANQLLLSRARKLEKMLTDPSASKEVLQKLEGMLQEEQQASAGLRWSLSEREAQISRLQTRFEETQNNSASQEIESLKRQLARADDILQQHKTGGKTPRPEWRRFASTLDLKGSTTIELVDELVSAVRKYRVATTRGTALSFTSTTKLRSSPDQTWMVALGTGDDIPSFLRADGRLPNTFMTKRQAEFLVKEIWRARRFVLNPEGSFGAFFHAHISKKHPDKHSTVIYNLIATLQDSYADPDCSLFLQCIFGETNEGVARKQADAVRNFESELRQIEIACDGAPPVVCREELYDLAQARFGAEMRRALDRDLLAISDIEDVHVPWQRLFQNDHQLNESSLVVGIRASVTSERDAFVGRVEDSILSLAATSLEPSQVSSCLLAVDANTPRTELAAILHEIFDPQKANTDNETVSPWRAIVMLRRLLLTHS
ncbi:hypothetical protein DIPPA_22740 [Diplonema papillatum]|nr:hypothetical protein DIPPA_22740 [Diplonema papillatum]